MAKDSIPTKVSETQLAAPDWVSILKILLGNGLSGSDKRQLITIHNCPSSSNAKPEPAKLMLPPSDELKAQLAEIKYMYDRKTGELIIEPKDELSSRLGGSPDESDALTQTYAPIDRLIAAIQKKSYRPSPGAFGG
mgnify:CR=1 FL=1